MRRMWIAGLAIALTTTMVALAQKTTDAAPAKATEEKAIADKAATEKSQALEQLLAKALQNSPDVQVAEARLKEAEAALRQARMLVAQKTVELQLSIDQKQQVLSSLESQHKRIAQLRQAGTISSAEVTKIEGELAAQKAQVAQVESQLNMATGRSPLVLDLYRVQAPLELQMMDRRWRGIPENAGGGLGGGGGGAGVGEMHSKRQPPQATADRLRKLLNTPFKIPESSGQMPLRDVIAVIRKVSGAPVLTRDGADVTVTIDFNGEVTLGAYFQILCDSTPNLQIYVRDYGFLATTEQPPDDALPFIDFLHNVGGA